MLPTAIIIALLMSSVLIVAETPTDKTEVIEISEFKVGGLCGMCKTRIEKAAKVEGVVSAVWELKTQMLKVEYHPAIISLETIHKNIAAVGHDTEMFRADDEVYSKLPACCKYERFPITEQKDS